MPEDPNSPDTDLEDQADVRVLKLEERMSRYLLRRRELLIAELAEIDRLLGRPPTITTSRSRKPAAV